MKELRRLSDAMAGVPQMMKQVHLHDAKLQELESRVAKLENTSDSVTAASTVVSEHDMPLLLAGGWTDRDQATKGQEAIQSLESQIVDSWVSSGSKPILFMKTSSAQSRMKLRFDAAALFKTQFPKIWLRE
eukprot:5548753-Amphidinium_carterae.1